MELIRYDFQQRAENALYDRTQLAIIRNDTRHPTSILFAAPVASGKTKMTATVIDRLAGHFHDVAFFFISPSVGGLNENAYSEFKEYGLENVTIQSMMECVVRSRDGIKPGTLTVLGWSDIHSTKKNVQMRDGEQPTLKNILEKNETPILLFIDEAHSNRTRNTDAVKRLISPIGIVNITATPRTSDKSDIDDANIITIEPDEVAAEGKIKSHIIVNDAGDDAVKSIDPTWDGIIKAAMRCRDLLDTESRKCGMDVTHLMVVQLPNDKSDTDRKDTQHTMENMVRARDILKENGARDEDIIVWLAGQHDVDPTEIKDTRHKFLITKLAVSQGWNCPRANPWAKIRSTSESETLDAQTLGRFMRTEDPSAWRTNQAYRNDEMLNSAWVYTAEEDYDASLKGYSIRDEKYQIHMRDELKEATSGIRLVRIRAGERDYRNDVTSDQNVINGITKTLEDTINEWRCDTAKRSIARTDFDVVSMYDAIADSGHATGDKGTAIVTRDEARRYLYDFMLPQSRVSDHIDSIKRAIKRTVQDMQATTGVSDDDWFDVFEPDDSLSDEDGICLGIISHFDDFTDTVEALIDKNSDYSDMVWLSPYHHAFCVQLSSILMLMTG